MTLTQAGALFIAFAGFGALLLVLTMPVRRERRATAELQHDLAARTTVVGDGSSEC